MFLTNSHSNEVHIQNDDSETYGGGDFDLFNGINADYTQEENGYNYAAHYFKGDSVEDSYNPLDFLDYNVYDMNMKDGDSFELKEEKLPQKRKTGLNNKR